MKSDFPSPLDRNGYAESIVQDVPGCWCCCARSGKLDRHEIYHGLWVLLCHDCHMTLHQSDAALDAALKRQGQRVAMQHYAWSVADFRSRFGKNYL